MEKFWYLIGLWLEFIDEWLHVFDEERPGVEQVNLVHHDHDDTVSPLKSPGLGVFDDEHVA